VATPGRLAAAGLSTRFGGGIVGLPEMD